MMAIQLVCNRENDLCENKNKKSKTREKDTTRAEERRKGGRMDKADRMEEAASIDRPLHEVRMRPRESGCSSFFGAGRATSCPVARCHPAVPLPLRSDWQDRWPGHGRVGY